MQWHYSVTTFPFPSVTTSLHLIKPKTARLAQFVLEDLLPASNRNAPLSAGTTQTQRIRIKKRWLKSNPTAKANG